MTVDRQIATPDDVVAGGTSLAARYTGHVFEKTVGYDAANRITSESTGADVPELTANGLQVTAAYKAQGILDSVGSSYGALLTGQQVDAAGVITQQMFGDAASTTATVIADSNESPLRYVVNRSAGANGGAWTTYAQGAPVPGDPNNTFQTALTNVGICYDLAGNPTTMVQGGASASSCSPPGFSLPSVQPAQWPQGAQPSTLRTFSYYDDYRLQEAATQYAGPAAPNDTYVPPYTSQEIAASTYPAANPSTPATRVTNQTFAYDFRGNMTKSGDDKNTFFDRSLGQIGNGHAGGAAGPDQIALATGNGEAALTSYDAAGNLTFVFNSATGAIYTYSWDEVGRLATAMRTDRGNGVEERFGYDGVGDRIRTSEGTLSANGSADSHTVHVFDSLVLENASFAGSPADYETDAATEHVFLSAGGNLFGHVFYDPSLPTATSGNGDVHVFMPFGDLIGSISYVVDHDTGEVVESATYQAYGAVESDYRPARWHSFREDIRYTGHWDDSKVGLVAFGARYYFPALNRWLSPDPLTIHGLSGDLNPYAFVGGLPIGTVDPVGLQGYGPPGCDNLSQGCGGGAQFSFPVDFGAIAQGIGNAATAVANFVGGELSSFGASVGSVFAGGGEGDVGWGGGFGGSSFVAGAYGLVAPSGPIGQYLAFGNYPGSNLVQDDRALQRAQYAAGGVALAAGTVATGGVLLEAVGATGAAGGVGSTLAAGLQPVIAGASNLSAAEVGIGLGVGGGAVAGAEALGEGPVSVEATEITGVQANRLIGNAAADELASSLAQTGLTVEREVYYATPFGARFADIRVSSEGQVLGLVEVKVGNSAYTVSQQLKDMHLWTTYGLPTNLVRFPKYP